MYALYCNIHKNKIHITQHVRLQYFFQEIEARKQKKVHFINQLLCCQFYLVFVYDFNAGGKKTLKQRRQQKE